MGQATLPLPVKLIMPMLSAHPGLFDQAEQVLVAQFGCVDYRSPRVPFSHTNYYEREFGPSLERQFLAFATLIDPGQLAEIKVFTNGLEARLSQGAHRLINLDPGYISEAKVVLATTKNHGHRIYIGRGIYAEVTLTYRDKAWRPWPWTYPDYQSELYLQILRVIRDLYLTQTRTARQSRAATRR